jgi:hypothetical protein
VNIALAISIASMDIVTFYANPLDPKSDSTAASLNA